ncbi:NRT2 ribosyltransferase, partial [Nesospiza acunhae]|nr:NRT2 ribosyltransferase [Nesospiza acunhae]
WLLPTMALQAHILALLAMTMATAIAIKVVPLDMAQDSFDDQYRGCTPVMNAALPFLYGVEYQRTPHFAWGWVKAQAEWRKRGSRVSPLASPAQAIAVMAYSMKYFYKDFNAAVRTGGRSRQEYRNNFHFKMVRFGHFTSTSLSKDIAQKYGTDTIFEVHTCHGVNIQAFSYDPSNREVLIPPFETFKVTKVTRDGQKTRISLRSTGTFSKYNCAWL